MADFSLLHFPNVEDIAPKHGMENIEARFPNAELGLEKTGISLQKLAPDHRFPFGHRHAEQEEIYVVLRGSGRAKLDDEIVDLRTMDVLRVPGPTTRGFESGPDGMELLVFGAPRSPDDPPGGDSEMDAGFWPA